MILSGHALSAVVPGETLIQSFEYAPARLTPFGLYASLKIVVLAL
jgi:hypothetical protein